TCAADRREFRDVFHAYRDDLIEGFQRHRPWEKAYSPLCLFFNFAHNVLKGMVVDALLWGEAGRLTLNDMLTGVSDAAEGEPRVKVATTLMGYARKNPDRIRGRLMPVIVYDPQSAREAFSMTLRRIGE